MVKVHLGPIERDPGATSSEQVIARILHDTHVSATQAERGQWGFGKHMLALESPSARLTETHELVMRLVSENAGGDANGNDLHCPWPRANLGAWSEACSDAEGRLDEVASGGCAEESHRLEGEMGEEALNAVRLAYAKGHLTRQLEFSSTNRCETPKHSGARAAMVHHNGTDSSNH